MGIYIMYLKADVRCYWTFGRLNSIRILGLVFRKEGEEEIRLAMPMCEEGGSLLINRLTDLGWYLNNLQEPPHGLQP